MPPSPDDLVQQYLRPDPRSRFGGMVNTLGDLAGQAFYASSPEQTGLPMAMDPASRFLTSQAASFLFGVPEEAKAAARPSGPVGAPQYGAPQPVHPRVGELDKIEQDYNAKVAAEDAARQMELQRGGFTEYAPGVAYRMDTPPSQFMGPPEQRTAFGRTYTPARSGGVASMMQSSGTPGARARELERRSETLQDLRYQQKLQAASMSPQQAAGLRQKQDPRMVGLQLGMQALGSQEDYISREVGTLNAQAAARGVQPSPAQMQLAVENARRKYQQDQLELARLAISQDRPDPYAGIQ